MSESPKSEDCKTRFSTPDNALDDHRNQPESLPRPEHIHLSLPGRHGLRRSTGGEPPPMQSVTEQGYPRTIARDFENAIVDDDKSDNESVDRRFLAMLSSPVSPNSGNRNNGFSWRERRPSTLASRSVSPPNSVEAFAERRRRPRAGTSGTVNSQAPSFLSLHRTRSNGSFKPRQLTEDKPEDNSDDSISDQGSVEDDVCYPQQDLPSNPHEIDFDDLHEFVAAHERQSTPYVHPFMDVQAPDSAQAQRNYFGNLRVKTSCQSLPTIVTHAPVSGMVDSDVADGITSDMDEKEIEVQSFNAKLPPYHPTAKERINRWSFFSSELEETIHAPELGDLLMPGDTFEHLFSLGPDGGVWWLDMLMPSEDEVEVICKAFNIHGLTREDIITQETREKVELFKSYYFVCFRSFYQMDKESEYYMEPVNVYAVVFREGILTFTFCPSPHAGNVRKRMGKLRDYVALGSDWICYALIDDIVDSFQPIIQVVEHESEAIEDGIFTARAEDSRVVLRQIGECRKKVMSLIRLLGGKADVIKGFAKRCTEQYSIAPRQDVGMYLSDIQDHVVTMMSNLGHFEKMLSRSHTNYLAQINVENIAQGNRANEALSKVTLIATILVPLNLICGLFGMNVPVPGRNSESLGWFFGIVGILFAFVCISLVVAKKTRFI